MKKGGMRDSPQKGAGMRDQDPPSRPCLFIPLDACSEFYVLSGK